MIDTIFETAKKIAGLVPRQLACRATLVVVIALCLVGGAYAVKHADVHAEHLQAQQTLEAQTQSDIRDLNTRLDLIYETQKRTENKVDELLLRD